MNTMDELIANNPEDFEAVPESESGDISEEATPLCLNCLRPCNPYDYYCSNCDSNDTVNPLAAYLPFVQIRYNYGFFGKVWRKIWYGKETADIIKILYLSFLALYVPFFLIAGIIILFISRKEQADLLKEEKLFFYVLSILLIILFVLIFSVSLGFALYR
jgi:hypothetical protein